MINPRKGNPKAKNNGTLNSSIYDRMYNPNYDVVFMQKGFVNALSMKCLIPQLFASQKEINNSFSVVYDLYYSTFEPKLNVKKSIFYPFLF